MPAPQAADSGGFYPLVALGVLAMFTLPHQFHVGVVECRDERHVLTARWLFPLYLVLIALPVLPLARAGDALLAGQGVPSDLYVLALPMAQSHEGLALFAFLGGLSAATGMVVVSTLTLSLMIGNHWLAPGLLRGAWSRGDAGDLRGHVLLLRRLGIVAIMLLAWGYSRGIAGNAALADVGALSFSALATLAPALRNRGPSRSTGTRGKRASPAPRGWAAGGCGLAGDTIRGRRLSSCSTRSRLTWPVWKVLSVKPSSAVGNTSRST